jgi:hypothetical protein
MKLMSFSFKNYSLIWLLISSIYTYDYIIDPSYPLIDVNKVSQSNLSYAMPTTVGLPNGNFIVVYQTQTTKTTSNNYFNIVANVFDKTGKLLNSLIPNNQNSDFQVNPNVAPCQDNGFVVVWNDTDNSTFNNILMRKYSSDFTPGTIIQVNSSQPKTISTVTPRVRQLKNGGFIVTWWHDYSANGDFDCFGQLYDSMLNPVGTKITLSQTIIGSQTEADVDVFSNGGLVAAWITGHLGSPKIFGRMFDATGKPTGGEFQVTTSSNQQKTSRVAVTETDKFVMKWDENSDVYVQMYTSTGTTIGSNFITHKITNGIQGLSAIASLPIGGFVVVYQNDVRLPDWSITANIYDDSGKIVGDQDRTALYVATYNYLLPSVGKIPGVGFVVTAFKQKNDGDVSAQIFFKDYCTDLKFIKAKINPFLIDFSSIPSSKITITTLPSAGTLNTKANVAITSNSQYSKTDIYFSSNSAVTTSFTYKTNSIDQPCRVDIISCYASCATCDTAGNEVANLCTACDNANSYYPIDSQPTSQCFKSPMNGYYLDNNILYKCYDTCKTCSGAGAASNPNCITCNDNYYPLSDKPALCYKLTQLIPGYVFVITDNIFKPCYPTCATCKDIGTQTFNSCTDCATNFAKTVDDTSMCYPKDFPKDGYYFDTITNLFQKCYYTCKTCSSGGDKTNANCLICADNYPKCNDKCTKFAYNDLCLDTCPVGTISDYLKMTCTTCQTGYYISNNSCVNKCPDGYKADTSSVCQIDNTVNITINNGSTSTTSTTTQQSCGVNYLYNGTCVDKCPDGTITVGQICQPQLTIQGILVLI